MGVKAWTSMATTAAKAKTRGTTEVLPTAVAAMQPVQLKQWMEGEAAVCQKEMEMAVQGDGGASLVAQYEDTFYTNLADLGEAPLHRGGCRGVGVPGPRAL